MAECPYFLDWRSNDRDIAILLFGLLHSYSGSSKNTKLSYLSHLTSNQESKDILFPSTLKVDENRVSLLAPHGAQAIIVFRHQKLVYSISADILKMVIKICGANTSLMFLFSFLSYSILSTPLFYLSFWPFVSSFSSLLFFSGNLIYCTCLV